MEGDYVEEETLQVLPLDDEFCEAVDSSIHRAVEAAMGPFERRIMKYAYAIQADQAKRAEKCKLTATPGQGVFERLRTAFLAKAPRLEQEALPETPEEQPFLFEGDDDSEEDSLDDQAGPSTNWYPSNAGPEPSSQPEELSDMLVPEDLVHPRSSAWVPSHKVSAFMARRLRKPLEKEVRACLRAECPRPVLPGKVATTPEVDQKMATFLQKYIRDPKKGIDRSWKNCQDKLLDLTGPLTKILELAEEAKSTGSALSPERVSNWAQRAIVFLGNAN